jgi:hypothetical protein
VKNVSLNLLVKLKKFRDERAKEEKKLEQEVKDEWEKRLKLIQSQYEQDLQKKKDQKVIERNIYTKF